MLFAIVSFVTHPIRFVQNWWESRVEASSAFEDMRESFLHANRSSIEQADLKWAAKEELRILRERILLVADDLEKDLNEGTVEGLAFHMASAAGLLRAAERSCSDE